MKCYNCKTAIPDGARFCPNCGKAQETDRELIDAAAAGDQAAMTDLYNRTYNAVYNTVRFMVKDEDAALDILQDSYIKAFDSLGQLQEAGRFEAWIKRIAHNKAIDYLRTEKPILFSEMAEDDSDETLEFEDDRPENLPEVVIDRQETTRLINEILDSLPEDQRACITLFYYDQLSVKEIAEELGIPEATVKSRLQYGRKKIETQVRTLEKKGTKLYSLAPLSFLMLLFRQQTEAMEIPSHAVLQNVLAGSAGQTASAGAAAEVVTGGVQAAHTGSAVQAAAAAAKTAAGAAVKQTVLHTAGKALVMKIVAAVAAVAVTAGGTVAAVHHFRGSGENDPNAAVTQTASAQVPETLPEPTMPEASSEVLRPTVPPVPETPPMPTVPTEPETEEPATQTEEELPPEHVYDAVLERYRELLSMDAQDYMDKYQDKIEGNQSIEHTDDVNYELIGHALWYGEAVGWGMTDYNGDGVNELIIVLGDSAWAVYSTDGQQAHELCLTDHLGYLVTMYVLADGNIMIHRYEDRTKGSDTICRIAPDGSGLEVITKYIYDGSIYGNMDHVSSVERLTDAEFIARFWDQAVEAAHYGEITFHELAGPGLSMPLVMYVRSQLGIPDDLDVEYKIDLDHPVYWESGGKWLINCEFYHNGTLIACAQVDQSTFELVRNIMIYSGG